MRFSNFASYPKSDSAYKTDVCFGPVARVLLTKGFDEKGIMNVVLSEVLKYHVFTVRLSSSDCIPNRYWTKKFTVKYAVFFRMREGVSLPVMFRYDCYVLRGIGALLRFHVKNKTCELNPYRTNVENRVSS